MKVISAADDLVPGLEKLRESHRLPALAAAVVSKGEIIALGVTGFRRAGGETRVTIDDKFHIGSNTKSMTATLAAMLVEEGTIRWDTTLGETFPEWNNSIDAAYNNVTLEQLLTHHAGVPAVPPPLGWKKAWGKEGTPTQQRLEFCKSVLAEPPKAPPGTKAIYSNQGYAIAGAMLEKAAHTSWEELIQKKLFVPLNMDTAGFGAPSSVGLEDQPWGHLEKKGAFEPVAQGPKADNPPSIAPAGTVHCSINDMARYVIFHLSGERGGSRLLSSSSFKKLHTPVENSNYGFGWGVVKQPWSKGPVLNHAGSNTMFYSVMWLAPEEEFGVIVETNCAGSTAEPACDEVASTLIKKYLTIPLVW